MKNKPYKIEIEGVDEYAYIDVYENEHKPYPTKTIVIKPYDVYIENNKLNNTIDELEKLFKEDIQTLNGYEKDSFVEVSNVIKTCKYYLDKIKELKGSGNDDNI